MKKIFSLMLAFACAMFVGVSCTPDTPQDDPQGPTYTSKITVTGAPEANLAPAAGELTLGYAIENATLTDALEVTTDATWVHVGEIGEATVAVTYDANTDAPGAPAREAVIKFAYKGAQDVLVTLKQDTEAAQFELAFSEVSCNYATYVCTPADSETLYLLASSQDLAQYGVAGETPAELMKNYADMLAMYGMLTGEADQYFVFQGANTEMPKEVSRWSAEDEVKVYAVGINATVTGEVDEYGAPIVNVAYTTAVHAWDVPFLPYPSLTIAEGELTHNVTAAAGEVVVNCVLENPMEGVEVEATTDAAWVTPSYADGKLTLAYEANTAAVSRRAKISVAYGYYTEPIEITLNQEKDPAAQAITLEVKVTGTAFNGIWVNVTPSDKDVTYAMNYQSVEKDWETGAELATDWTTVAENLLNYPGNATFHKGDLTGYFIKMNPSNFQWYGYDYYVYAVAVDATSEEGTDYYGNPKTTWTVNQILSDVAYDKTTVDVSKMPSLEWDLTKNPELVWNENAERYDLEVVEGSTLVLHYIVNNPVEGGIVKLNGNSLYDSYNVVDGEPVVDNVAGTVTMKIDKFDTAKNYHYVSPSFTYTNAEGDTWGITTPSLRLTQVEAPAPAVPAVITSVADLTAGNYYVAGKLASYTSGSSSYDWTNYPYHFWTGAVSAPGNTSSNSDLLTVNGNEAMELDPNMSSQDAAKGNPGVVTLVAVDGKANTYYVKVGDQYLYCAVASTNRRMQLGSEPTEWVFADHSKGGIDLTSNGVHLATAGATYNMIRSYKDSSAGSSHQYGLVFFPVAE